MGNVGELGIDELLESAKSTAKLLDLTKGHIWRLILILSVGIIMCFAAQGRKCNLANSEQRCRLCRY